LLYNEGEYILEKTIFDKINLDGGNIKKGYIQLPYDIRKVPLRLKIKDEINNESEKYIDSFSEAIVRAVDENALKSLENDDSLPYGSYIRAEDFTQIFASTVLEKSASDLQNLKRVLRHKIVLVGGAWHNRAFKYGSQVDTYLTPVGYIGGVFIHANYVEALLDSRTYKPLRSNILFAIEFLISIIVAMIFALSKKASSKIIIVSILCLFFAVFSYFSLQNLGVFFDIFVPIISLGGHVIIEQVREWREVAHRYVREKER
jgi:hypothetical protein